MAITVQQLNELGFRLTHDCQRKGESVSFVPAPEAHRATLNSSEPMVYAWLSPTDDGFEALYVGKAGLGVSQRLKQHASGFRHSSSGRANLKNILELVNENRRLAVYARKSGVDTILGIKSVNLYSAEEEAAHEILQPKWNRAEFATGRQKSLAAAKAANLKEQAELPEDDRSLVIGPVDFSGLLHADVLRGFLQGLSAKDKSRLTKLLRWAGSLQASQEASIKMVGSYENQPPGYDKVATLLMAPLGKKGRALPNAWVLRIPLRSDENFPLTVTLPLDKLSSSVRPDEISQGKHRCFRPLDLDAFLSKPSHYTTQS